MIYDYECEKCENLFEIESSMKDYSPPYNCPTCGNVGLRKFTCKTEFYGAKIEDAEFNHGLGCITKSKKHRDELAKSRGLIEIGTECPNKIYDSYEKQRSDKIKKTWENL